MHIDAVYDHYASFIQAFMLIALELAMFSRVVALSSFPGRRNLSHATTKDCKFTYEGHALLSLYTLTRTLRS
jgi:hypothetical protein